MKWYTWEFFILPAYLIECTLLRPLPPSSCFTKVYIVQFWGNRWNITARRKSRVQEPSIITLSVRRQTVGNFYGDIRFFPIYFSGAIRVQKISLFRSFCIFLYSWCSQMSDFREAKTTFPTQRLIVHIIYVRYIDINLKTKCLVGWTLS